MLSAVSGIEVVTVLFLSFCFTFGVRKGMLTACVFSLLRCLLFGFYPTVVILYVVYYNLFAVVFGLLGDTFNHKLTTFRHAVLVVTAVVLTVIFTLIDNVLTPLFYSFTEAATKAYWLMSLTSMLPQIICVAVTVIFLLPSLLKAYKSAHIIPEPDGFGL